MIKRHLNWAGIAWMCVAFSLSTASVPLPSPTPVPNLPDPPYAIVTYSDGSSVVTAGDGVFMPVGVQPDQVVQVTVQYPSGQALQIIDLEAIDGGAVAPPALAAIPVAPTPSPSPLPSPCPGCIPLSRPNSPSTSLTTDNNATLSFTFQAAHTPGINQISLRQGSQEIGLQFWVFDQQNPQFNPTVITPANPRM